MNPIHPKTLLITSLIFISSIILAILVTIHSYAQQPPVDQSALVQTWLLKNCGLRDKVVLESEIIRIGRQLEPTFLEALKNGPDTDLLSEFDRMAAMNFEQRQKLLSNGADTGLSPQDIEAARDVSFEQYRSKEKEDFILRYKSQAIIGLGLVGGKEAKKVLTPISLDQESPLQSSAKQALKRMEDSE